MTPNENKVIQKFKQKSSALAFEAILGERNAKEFVYSVMIAVKSNKALMACEEESVYTCALRAATLNLSVDPGVAEAYLVPFKKKCTLIVSKKGLYNMALRTDKYRYINVGKIYEGQEVIEDQISGLHSIEGRREKGGEIIGYIGAFAYFSGYGKTIYMSIEEIHEHKEKYSPSYNHQDSAWKTATRAMEEKTVLRRLLTRWGELRPGDKAVLEQIAEDNEMPLSDTDDFEEGEFSEAEEAPYISPELVNHELGNNVTKKDYLIIAEKDFKLLPKEKDLVNAVWEGCNGDGNAAVEGLRKQIPPDDLK